MQQRPRQVIIFIVGLGLQLSEDQNLDIYESIHPDDTSLVDQHDFK